MPASQNGLFTLFHNVSYTSIFFPIKLAAYKKGTPASVASVTPLYTAPMLLLATSAAFPEFQPEITPSSPTKINLDGLPLESLKPVVPLNTMPVGAPPVTALFVGIVTAGLNMAPMALYIGLSPDPLAESHAGPEGANVIPHPFSSVGSTVTAP